MSDKEKGKRLTVLTSNGNTPVASPIISPADSPPRSRRISRVTRGTAPARLPAELAIKVRTQFSRLVSMREIAEAIPQSHTDTSLVEVSLWSTQLDQLSSGFAKEHSYFEVTWPEAFIDHAYFANDTYQEATSLYMRTKIALEKLRLALLSPQGSDAQRGVGEQCDSKLPDISLPKFQGEYSQWPTFRELFTSLIMESRRFTDVEKLYYLRGCMEGAPAHLVSSLPLTGASLQPCWDLLVSRYDSKRLSIQAQLDLLMNVAPVATRSAAALTTLISTVSEATKALGSLGVSQDLGDCILVYHVSRCLDRSTREAWETSLGSSVEYPKFAQLEAFVTSRARALERIKITPPQSTSSSRRPAKRSLTAHQASTQPLTSTRPGNSKSKLYSCDCCSSGHFVVMCSRFRDLSIDDRHKLVVKKSLCFNCLGRHNVRSCRSTQACRTCSERHHTMLHGSHQSARPAKRTALRLSTSSSQ